MKFTVIMFLFLVGCAHIQEMHPLQVQASIANSCWKNNNCVDGVSACFDILKVQYLSKMNQCQKELFCQRCPEYFDEAAVVKQCVKTYRKAHEDFR